MIRSLAPDELVWFLSRAYAFLGHSDPMRFASQMALRLREPTREGNRTHVLFRQGQPVAGIYAVPPEVDQDDQSLLLSHPFYEHSADDLTLLLRALLERFDHEAVYVPLHGYPAERIAALEPVFADLGFVLDKVHDLIFDLNDVPPQGMPLVLEAWNLEAEGAFRRLYEEAEGAIGDRRWAWMKRWRGRFLPDLWFLARETLDQEPVGYAFTGAFRTDVDGRYYLTAAGVLPEHRGSSDMLKRLLVSLLHELSSRSPFGVIETTLSKNDPKLIRILESLGFETTDRYRLFIKRPA